MSTATADPVIEKMFNENPLIVFSFYTHTQVQYLTLNANEIVKLLDDGQIRAKGAAWQVDMQHGRVYGMFWLWMLGAYEVVRTMRQAEECFSSKFVGELDLLKEKLSLIRMPFAKQELRGLNVPIGNEASIVGFGNPIVDMHFSVDGRTITIRELIGDFKGVFTSVRRADVLADHRTAYKKRISKSGGSA